MPDDRDMRPLDAALERAAGPADQTPTRSESETPAQNFILMRLGSRWFALHATSVQRVVLKGAITRVPGHTSDILGIALLHDGLVPVLDLATMADVTDGSETVMTEPRMVVVSDGESNAAVLADEARGVETFRLPELSPGKGVVRAEFYYDDKQVCLLDVAKLVAAANQSGEAA